MVELIEAGNDEDGSVLVGVLVGVAEDEKYELETEGVVAELVGVEGSGVDGGDDSTTCELGPGTLIVMADPDGLEAWLLAVVVAAGIVMSPTEGTDMVVPWDGTAVRVSSASVLLPLSTMTSRIDTISVSSALIALEIWSASCRLDAWWRTGVGVICGLGISSRRGGVA